MLLQNGTDCLLLQNGTDQLLQQDGSGCSSACGALLQSPNSVFLLQNGTDALLLQDGSGDCGGGVTTMELSIPLPFESLDTPLFEKLLSLPLPYESKGSLNTKFKLPYESKGSLTANFKLPYESGGADTAVIQAVFNVLNPADAPQYVQFRIMSSVLTDDGIQAVFNVYEGEAGVAAVFNVYSGALHTARISNDVQCPVGKVEIE